MLQVDYNCANGPTFYVKLYFTLIISLWKQCVSCAKNNIINLVNWDRVKEKAFNIKRATTGK